MTPLINKFFQGDRKYFSIVLLVLILILVSAITTPVITDKVKENWKNKVSEEIAEIETEINDSFREKEDFLLTKSGELKKGLRKVLDPGNVSYGNIIGYINKNKYSEFAVEIYAPNGRLISWNENAPIHKELPFPLAFPQGQAHFSENGLVTWLTYLDTINFDSDHFYLIVNLPFQKQYRFENPYYKDIDFSKDLSNKLLTTIQIDYSLSKDITKDGRYHTYNILNREGSRIASANFLKPLLDASVNTVNETSSLLQGFLLITAYIFLFFGFRSDFKQVSSSIIKFLAIAAYIAGFRVLLYLVNIPAVFINGVLDDPSLFSSAFGWGIVKTPVEFLITSIFLLILVVKFFNYQKEFFKEKHKPFWSFLVLFPSIFLFLMSARGLNAAVRSIIFDSSIRYFKNPEIIPDLPEMIMLLNLLITGTIVVILLVFFIILPLSFRLQDKIKFFWIYFILFQISGFMFIELQSQPLVTPVMQIIFISLVFIVVWLYYLKPDSVYNFIYFATAASFISISLLNYFNQHLERESLKTIALELNRPNDDLLNFLLRETLRNAASDENVINSFIKREPNFPGTAFAVWSNSPLQRESLNSSVSVLDRNKTLLGEFKIGTFKDSSPGDYFENYNGDEIRIVEIQRDNYIRIFKGIAPVKINNQIFGFISASVLFDIQNPSGVEYPDFLISSKNIFNSVIDASQLNIFEIFNSKLTHVSGDIYPSRDQIKPIISADYSYDSENWQVLTLNNERYLAYSLKNIVEGNEKITVVLHKEKQITWNLFNFFKIFIVHVIFILCLFITLFLFNLKLFRYTFRLQLLTAFLLISIIPVIILAIYNRQAVSERSTIAVLRELNERLDYVEVHVQSQMLKHKERDFNDAFSNAASELGISFNVYDNAIQTFSSKDQFYKSGLFIKRLNPIAHYQLNYLSFREYLTKQEIENYPYYAFYKKTNIEGKDLILGVNDAFNKVKLSFTSSDADILLFGVYSFAVIIIIIINTLLANRISAPIRQLIRATGAVAHGDLNVQVENKERGELRDLISGFNSMTRELQKNEIELAQLERETAWKEIAKQVAHEIKNPLTPMKLAVQQMIISYKENKNFESIFNKVSSTLLNQIENLNQIASEFSRFARMPHFNLEKINLTYILRDTVNLFTDEKIKITIEAGSEEAFVEGDNSQFRRLFINLIRNSIQSGADIINFTLNSCESGFEIQIKDNGNGILPEFQERIFEPDFTTKEKGMGLGLKLAKRFIDGIGGTITLLSSSPKGTTFRIYVPEVK